MEQEHPTAETPVSKCPASCGHTLAWQGQPLGSGTQFPWAGSGGSALPAPSEAARGPRPPRCPGTPAQRPCWLGGERARCRRETAAGSQLGETGVCWLQWGEVSWPLLLPRAEGTPVPPVPQSRGRGDSAGRKNRKENRRLDRGELMGLGRSHRHRGLGTTVLFKPLSQRGRSVGKAATNLGRTGPADVTP